MDVNAAHIITLKGATFPETVYHGLGHGQIPLFPFRHNAELVPTLNELYVNLFDVRHKELVSLGVL